MPDVRQRLRTIARTKGVEHRRVDGECRSGDRRSGGDLGRLAGARSGHSQVDPFLVDRRLSERGSHLGSIPVGGGDVAPHVRGLRQSDSRPVRAGCDSFGTRSGSSSGGGDRFGRRCRDRVDRSLARSWEGTWATASRSACDIDGAVVTVASSAVLESDAVQHPTSRFDGSPCDIGAIPVDETGTDGRVRPRRGPSAPAGRHPRPRLRALVGAAGSRRGRRCRGRRAAVITLDSGPVRWSSPRSVPITRLDADQVLLGWCGSEPAPRRSHGPGVPWLGDPLSRQRFGSGSPGPGTLGGRSETCRASGRDAEPIDLYRSLG